MGKTKPTLLHLSLQTISPLHKTMDPYEDNITSILKIQNMMYSDEYMQNQKMQSRHLLHMHQWQTSRSHTQLWIQFQNRPQFLF